MKNKLMAVLMIVSMIAMMLPGISSSPEAPQTGAAIESGNLNPTCQYVIYADQDTYTSSDFRNTNFNIAGYMNMTNNADVSPASVADAYVHFDLSDLPDDLSIDSASIELYLFAVQNTDYASSGIDGFPIFFSMPMASWDSSTLTWNTAPMNDTSAGSIGFMPRLNPYNDPTGFFVPTIQNFLQYLPFDITLIVKNWYASATPNYGIVMPGNSMRGGITYGIAYFGTQEHVGSIGSWTRLIITAHSLKSDVHLSYYNAFTGLGIAPYTFNVSTAIGSGGLNRTTQDIASAIIGSTLTVNVTDYFGRTLYNQTRMINDSDYFWDIALPVYSYKFTNNGDQYTRLWMYYDPAQPPYRCFIPPHETESFYLYPGWYRFAATVFDANGVTGQTYTWVRTVSDIGYVMLNGATITEVLSTAQGIQAQQKVITDILTPNVIWMGYDMPMVPSHILMTNSSSTLPTRIVVESNTIQTQSGNFTSWDSTAPAAANVTTLSILYDDFYFTGNYSTHIMINTSAGTVVYNATILPSGLSLLGKDYTVWTNQTISATRNTGFRYTDAFSYHYYPSGHPLGSMIYEADVAFQNPSITSWRSVDLFIPFQNSTYADNRSLVVWDLNNSIYLTEGVHYSVSNTGVYMFFPLIGNGTWRGFRIDYSTANNTPMTSPRIIVTTVGDASGSTMTWQSVSWYFAKAEWLNTYSAKYSGSLYIEMQTNPAMDYTQQVVVQNENGYVLTDVIIAGTTIIVPSVTVNVGDKVSYTILFRSAPSGPATGMTFADLSLTTFLSVIMSGSLIISFLLKVVGYRSKNVKRSERLDKYADNLLLIGLVALAAILFLIIYVMGTG